MSYRIVNFGLVLQLDPRAAKAELLTCFKGANGSTKAVADWYGVHASTVRRWVEHLESAGFPVRTKIERYRQAAA